MVRNDLTVYRGCKVFKVMVKYKIMVMVTENVSSENVAANPYLSKPRHPISFYVLCRDAKLAIDNVIAYISKWQNDQANSGSHTISLALSTRAVGLN